MGTRADFYIGRGQDAEWLGSVALDGDAWVSPSELANATTPDQFRAVVLWIAKSRNDFTSPEEGWPWPWNDSNLTDFAYVLHEGKVTAYCFGCEFTGEEREEDAEKVDWFPNMSARKNVQWGAKSGMLMFR